MNRRQWMLLSGSAAALGPSAGQQAPSSPADTQTTPDKFLLKDYRPKSIYKIPITEVKRAKYPAIDVHCHGARPIDRLEEWVKAMDAANVEKAVIFTGANSGERVAEVRKIYSKYPGRFDMWCSFDLTGNDQPGFGPNAVKALEDCHRAGATGVGEVSDKGRGFASRPFGFGGSKKVGRRSPRATPAAASRPPCRRSAHGRAVGQVRAVGHAHQHSRLRSHLVV